MRLSGVICPPLLQVHHSGGGQMTPDNLIPSRVELISTGGPHLIPPSCRLVEKRDTIQGFPLESTLLNPPGHVGCNLVLDDDRPGYISVVLRVVLRHPVDISSTATVVEAVLRSWSSVQINQPLHAELIEPAESPLQIEKWVVLVGLVRVWRREWFSFNDIPVPIAHRNAYMGNSGTADPN